jgi:hypothetical protein
MMLVTLGWSRVAGGWFAAAVYSCQWCACAENSSSRWIHANLMTAVTIVATQASRITTSVACHQGGCECEDAESADGFHNAADDEKSDQEQFRGCLQAK